MNLTEIINGIPERTPQTDLQNQVLLRVISNLLAQYLSTIPGGFRGVQTDLKGLEATLFGLEGALNTGLNSLETTISKHLTSPTVQIAKSDLEALKAPLEKIKFPEPLKQVEISNLDETLKKLDSLKESIDSLKDIEKAVKSLKFESKDEVKVLNLDELTKKIDSLQIEVSKIKLESPDTVKVSNLQDLKIPTFELNQDIISLLEHLKYLSNDPQSPLSVRLTDGKKFYDALTAQTQAIHGVATSSPSFFDVQGNPSRALLDANAVVRTSSDGYTKRVTYTGAGKEEYVGFANPGTATSAASWQIMKLTYDGSDRLTSILFADGNSNFDNIWDNRTGLTYA